MQEKRTELSVSTEVLEKITELATCEINGVVGITKKSIDIKGAVKARSVVKGVKVESVNGALVINVYICIDSNAKVREVSEAIQENVKDKIQTMTGAAVTRVNVNIADIEYEDK